MIETATFVCNICNEPSTDICVHCTKDACRNHRCERCRRCSDCCECDIPLTAAEPEVVRVEVVPAVPEASEEPDMNIPAADALEAASTAVEESEQAHSNGNQTGGNRDLIE